MQPAKSVEDALQTARNLLSGQTGQQAQAAQAAPGPDAAAMEEQAAAKSFGAIRGGA